MSKLYLTIQRNNYLYGYFQKYDKTFLENKRFKNALSFKTHAIPTTFPPGTCPSPSDQLFYLLSTFPRL